VTVSCELDIGVINRYRSVSFSPSKREEQRDEDDFDTVS
jgi:hypothetical protein